MKLNGTHQLLVYVDVNTLVVIVSALKGNAKSLVVAGREIGLEVNADKTKYMVMYRGQNAGRSHSKKSDNSSFDRWEEFEYLGKNNTLKFYSERK
jgi:hypothetical protein